MSHHLNRTQIVHGIWRNLKDFGYDSLTEDFVGQQVAAILDRNERPTGIIAQFALTMLKEAGYIAIEPDGEAG